VIEEMGYKARPMPGAQRTAVSELISNDGRVDSDVEGQAGRSPGHPGEPRPQRQVSRVAEHDTP
jgi:hypothetical protein